MKSFTTVLPQELQPDRPASPIKLMMMKITNITRQNSSNPDDVQQRTTAGCLKAEPR